MMNTLSFRRYILSGLVLVTLGLGWGGCESMRGGVAGRIREKFTGPVYETRGFAVTPERAFDAARNAVEQMGFRVTRAGQAQGVIAGLGKIASDNELRGSRQRTISVRLTLERDTVQIGVLITEIVEDDFGGGPRQATEVPYRESPLYTVFFRNVEQGLAVK
jgi:hypothetical protein